MVEKLYLQNIIQKYYLGGIIETVSWNLKSDTLFIDFITPYKNLLGNIEAKNIILKDSEFGIANTTKLLKLLSITNQNIRLDIKKEKSFYTKLFISDNNFDLEYALASLDNIPSIPKIEEPEYHYKIELTNEDILNIVKAKTALDETKIVKIIPYESIAGNDEIEIKFGEDNNFSNKISYYFRSVKKFSQKEYQESIIYDADLIKNIFYSNKELDNITLYLSLNGLLKIETETDLFKITYYLVQNEN